MIKRVVIAILAALMVVMPAEAQRITDSGYKSVGYIKTDGTIQDASYKTIGHIKSDGTVQDASYKTIGHAQGLPMKWAALFFFFR